MYIYNNIVNIYVNTYHGLFDCLNHERYRKVFRDFLALVLYLLLPLKLEYHVYPILFHAGSSCILMEFYPK